MFICSIWDISVVTNGMLTLTVPLVSLTAESSYPGRFTAAGCADESSPTPCSGGRKSGSPCQAAYTQLLQNSANCWGFLSCCLYFGSLAPLVGASSVWYSEIWYGSDITNFNTLLILFNSDECIIKLLNGNECWCCFFPVDYWGVKSQEIWWDK